VRRDPARAYGWRSDRGRRSQPLATGGARRDAARSAMTPGPGDDPQGPGHSRRSLTTGTGRSSAGTRRPDAECAGSAGCHARPPRRRPDQNGKTWTWRTSPHYPGRQIRFHGVPSVRFAAQVGADAPVAWRQGEAWPVKIVSLNELIEGDAPVTETPTGRRPVLGDTIITMDSGRSITVSIPAGHTVTVHTRG
jgi:hypothetical protein